MNEPIDQGVRNTLAITELLGHPEVKVYKGLPHSSTNDSFTVGEISAFVHGVNGIGDVEIPDSSREPETESAVDCIIDAVKTYGKELIYVPTGPMTNNCCGFEESPGNQGRNRPYRTDGRCSDRTGQRECMDRSQYLAGSQSGELHPVLRPP